MNIKMGSQIFANVSIPLLWGVRAVLQDKKKLISVINLEGNQPKIEILGDKPAPQIDFIFVEDGFSILQNEKPVYTYYPQEKLLTSIELELPDCQILDWQIRVGTNTFSGNIISGSEVGIAVTKEGISIGARLPKNLAKLQIEH